MDDHMTDEPQSAHAELARLADGSLTPQRAAQLRAQIERSPELTHALGEQERAISVLHCTDDVVAPGSLRLELEAMTQPAPGAALRTGASAPRRPRRLSRLSRPGWRLTVPAAATAAAIAVILALTGGGSATGLSLPQTVRVALASPTMAVPRPDPARRDRLSLSVDGISFPNWGQTVGSRADTIAGQRITTVYYSAPTGYRVGYSIVAGSPVPVSGGSRVKRRGIYTLATDGPAHLITWLRSGHTCVIAGRDISYTTLLALARSDAA